MPRIDIKSAAIGAVLAYLLIRHTVMNPAQPSTGTM
jgi:hypothetical protein